MEANVWTTSSLSGANGQCVDVMWRKAAASNPSGNCVEVGAMMSASRCAGGDCVKAGPCACGEDILMRDSKDPDGPVLQFGKRAFADFIGGIKAGEFDN